MASAHSLPPLPQPPWLSSRTRRLEIRFRSVGIFVLIGVVAGVTARVLGQPVSQACLTAVLVAFEAGIAVTIIPGRISIKRNYRLPGEIDRAFATATDPAVQSAASPSRSELVKSSGKPGDAGSTYTLRSARMTTVTRVLSSKPPWEITSETRGPFTRVTTYRTFQQVGGETEVSSHQVYRMPLWGVIELIIFRSEQEWYANEYVRRLRKSMGS